MPKRTRLAKGIYADRYGISVIYQSAGRSIETRFARGYSVERLERWRARQVEHKAVPAPTRNQLARDVVRYLKPLKGTAGYKAEKSHLRAWLQAFGPTTRRVITADQVELVLARWRQDGYAPRTVRHRVRALQSVYRKLDGVGAPTPLDTIRLPKKPKPRPVSVADTTIAAVALELRKHEIRGSLQDAKTRARFLVLATHAQRPAEVQRTRPEDVDLERRLWAVRGVKGSYNVVVPLNDEQVAAWQLFISALAWGAYDSRSFSKTLKRAGWPKTIRPYNLRHSTGFALSARGVDLGDIQALFGHTSPETTRSFYVPGQLERLTSANQKLVGRFAGDAFLPYASVPQPTSQDAKGRAFSSKKRRRQTA